MNYKESRVLFTLIKEAKKILVNCHRNPDQDSVGSALALTQVLRKMGKEVKVICPDSLPEELQYLPLSDVVEKVDFSKFDFDKWDLFIILDTAAPELVTGQGGDFDFKIPTILIDHHKTNVGFGKLNLIEGDISSTSELLFRIFKVWEVEITADIATCLLAGMIGDTGNFSYGGIDNNTFDLARDLMVKGADRELIMRNFLHGLTFETTRLVGEFLLRGQLDKSYKFAYTTLPFKDYKKYKSAPSSRDIAANIMAQIREANFSIVILEQEKGLVSVTFRSEGGFDVSLIASKFGGGGHMGAAGGKIKGLKFDEAVIKVLEVARKFADAYKN